jgi:lambda repressor-like predicted transcriptional regulator
MSKTAHAQTSAGSFATARRGGLSSEEIRMAEALRARERPVSWQNLARRFGCSEIDLKNALIPQYANDDVERWPFGPADDVIKAVIRAVADMHGVSLAKLAASNKGGDDDTVWKAQRAAYVATYNTGRVTLMQMEAIFGRDKASISRAMQRHSGAA